MFSSSSLSSTAAALKALRTYESCNICHKTNHSTQQCFKNKNNQQNDSQNNNQLNKRPGYQQMETETTKTDTIKITRMDTIKITRTGTIKITRIDSNKTIKGTSDPEKTIKETTHRKETTKEKSKYTLIFLPLISPIVPGS